MPAGRNGSKRSGHEAEVVAVIRKIEDAPHPRQGEIEREEIVLSDENPNPNPKFTSTSKVALKPEGSVGNDPILPACSPLSC